QPPLPGRPGAAVRPRAALPRGQDGRRRRHDRHRARPQPGIGPRLLLLALAVAAAEGGGDVALRALRREVQAGRRQLGQLLGQVLRQPFRQAAAQIPQPRDLTRAVPALIRLPATAARELRGAARVTAARGLLLVALLTGRLAGPAGRGTHAWHGRHAGHVPAEHGLHLLLALVEVRDQLGDLADGDAGTLGDARPAGAVDDLRVAPFLRRHGPDDGLGPVQVLVADLLDLLPVLARAGQHAEQVPDRAQLAHHGQLLDKVLQREALAGGDLAGHGRGLLFVERPLCLLDQGEHVAHVEDARRHPV